MNWLMRALSSSVGKKFVMGITGLLLCGFLVTHLAGNFLLYVGEEDYNHYANELHGKYQNLVYVAEVGLIALFLAHIGLAIQTSRENKAARGRDYAVKESKLDTSKGIWRAENWMFVSGAVILGFVILHLIDMRLHAWGLRPDLAGHFEGKEHFEITVMVLQTPLSRWGYLIGCAFLAWHLSHGFASALQSLGLNHPKYNPWFRPISIMFAVVIGLGFASFVLWAWLSQPPVIP